MTVISGYEVFVGSDGRLTFEGQEILQDLLDRLATAEAKVAAVAAVTGPSGGSTIDAEARTAIDAIIAAAT